MWAWRMMNRGGDASDSEHEGGHDEIVIRGCDEEHLCVRASQALALSTGIFRLLAAPWPVQDFDPLPSLGGPCRG